MRHPRSLPPLVASVLILGLCCASSVVAQEKPGAACEQARQAWLAANPLPTTYEQLLEVDTAHRNLALSAMTPALRSAMWRQHMTTYLEQNRYRLTELQVTLVQRGIDLASPLFFSFPADAPGRATIDAAIASFRVEAATLFTAAEAGDIFVRIGSQDGRFGTGTGPNYSRLPNCDCRFDSDCETNYCKPNSFPRICVFIIQCGFWAEEACTGLCSPQP